MKNALTALDAWVTQVTTALTGIHSPVAAELKLGIHLAAKKVHAAIKDNETKAPTKDTKPDQTETKPAPRATKATQPATKTQGRDPRN